EKGWDSTRWGPEQVEDADTVLMVSSDTLWERWRGKNPPDEGAGATRETDALKGLFDHNQAAFQQKVLIVVLPNGTENSIPLELRRIQYIKISELNDQCLDPLLRRLLNKPRFPRQTNKTIPDLPPYPPSCADQSDDPDPGVPGRPKLGIGTGEDTSSAQPITPATSSRLDAEGSVAASVPSNQGLEPADHGAPQNPIRLRRKRWLLAGLVVCILTAATATTAQILKAPDPSSEYSIDVLSTPDELVVVPKLGQGSGNYMTALPISRVPPPPDRRDSCNGRYDWAHQPPINAIDADASFALIRITPLKGPVWINGARLDKEDLTKSDPRRTLLACPGRGGNIPLDTLNVDLDSGERTFYPGGGDIPANLNLKIERGETRTILLSGSALDTHSRWRLELRLDALERGVHAITIGPQGVAFGPAADHPDQAAFETVGELLGTPYRFRDGRWQLGR